MTNKPNRSTTQSQQNSLTHYNEACRALAQARSVDEVKDIHDEAQACAAYARQAKNRDLECDAIEIRKRAEQRLGEMMAAQSKAKPPSRKGLAPGLSVDSRVSEKPDYITTLEDRVSEKPDPPATLKEAGIDKNLAHRARKMAALPPPDFEHNVKEARDKVGQRPPRKSRSKPGKTGERVGLGDDMPVNETEFIDEACPVSDPEIVESSCKAAAGHIVRRRQSLSRLGQPAQRVARHG
jgi:hypothetical protein